MRLIDSRASYSADGDTITLTAGSDYNVLGYSSSGEATGTLAFVGYSTSNRDENYRTYSDDLSLDGKIAVVLRFEPMNDDGTSRWVSDKWSPAAAVEPKLRAAAERGAAGIILVNPPGAKDARVGTLEGLTLAGRRALNIPVVMMTTEAADRLITAADGASRSLLEFRQLADTEGGVIDLPDARVTLAATVERMPADNVGGLLAGKGALADELIIIGAHYDHVGYGYFGSRDPDGRTKLHPGADDNASGTAGLLLISEKLAKAYDQLPDDANARSVLFMGFSAEESGLIGSRHYTKNMIRAVEKHYLMLNMDMIGRLRDDKIEVHGVGTSPGLAAFAGPFLDDSGMAVAVKKSGFGPSDHSSFTSARVPVLFYHTGLHDEYHMPTDHAWTIDCEGGARVCDLVSRMALAAALNPEPMPFGDGKTTPTKSTDPHSTAAADPNDPNEPAATSMRGTGVRFGIAPGDYSGDEPGVLIGEVFDGLPAAKAGLKTGDLMTTWNGEKIESVEAWMPLLNKARPGDKVVITYTRDGKELTAEATLVARARTNE